eukprot:8139750-Alexandrium_andersonii.AAC.1
MEARRSPPEPHLAQPAEVGVWVISMETYDPCPLQQHGPHCQLPLEVEGATGPSGSNGIGEPRPQALSKTPCL